MQENFILWNGTSIGLISVFTYLGIDHTAFMLYTILLFIDFLTGSIKAVKSRNFKSKRAATGFFSKFTLLLLIFSIGVFGKINHYDMSHILSGTFFALSLSELYSILANTYEIRTGKTVKEYDGVSIIISKALRYIRNIIDKIDEPYRQKEEENKK